MFFHRWRKVENSIAVNSYSWFNGYFVSIRPSYFIPNQTGASISWDDGKEVCLLWHWEFEFWSQFSQIWLYHPRPGNILQEYAYSESKSRKNCHYGNLHALKMALNATSSIAVVRHQDDVIWIFFQGQCHTPSPLLWMTADVLGIECTIKILSYISANVAATLLQTDGSVVNRAVELHISIHKREHPSHLGDFNPGVQQGGPCRSCPRWRCEYKCNLERCPVTSSWSKSLGWYLPNSNRDGGGSISGWAGLRSIRNSDCFSIREILWIAKLISWMSPLTGKTYALKTNGRILRKDHTRSSGPLH